MFSNLKRKSKLNRTYHLKLSSGRASEPIKKCWLVPAHELGMTPKDANPACYLSLSALPEPFNDLEIDRKFRPMTIIGFVFKKNKS